MNYKSQTDKEILESLCEDNVLKKPFYFYDSYESDIIKKSDKNQKSIDEELISWVKEQYIPALHCKKSLRTPSRKQALMAR